MRTCHLFILGALVGASATMAQQTDLAPIHPDETASQTLDERFSMDTAMVNLAFLRNASDSLVRLTAVCQGKVAPAEWAAIGNTDWESQHLGFRNAFAGIDGALRLQHLTIERLKLDLAIERRKNGVIGDNDVALAQKAFDEADRSFRVFWKSFSIAD